MKTTGEAWLGVPVVGKRLGLSPATLYRILDSGELPAYKFGRVIRIRRADVDEYLERVVRPGELAHLYPPGENGDPPRKR